MTKKEAFKRDLKALLEKYQVCLITGVNGYYPYIVTLPNGFTNIRFGLAYDDASEKAIQECVDTIVESGCTRDFIESEFVES